MAFKDRVGNDINVDDFLLYVTAGDRHPTLEFGWVLKFHESKDWRGKPSGSVKVKLQRAAPDGTRRTKSAVDIAGHWRPETPNHISTHRNADGSWYHPTWEERERYFVQTTYRDTGKPDTTMLDVFDGDNQRFMVIKPV